MDHPVRQARTDRQIGSLGAGSVRYSVGLGDSTALTAERDTQSTDTERACLVAISQVAHIGPVRLGRLRERFGSLDEAWRAPERDLRPVLDDRSFRSFISVRGQVDPQELLQRLEGRGARIATVLDSEYPYLLRQIAGPPPVLYYRGTLPPREETTVSIVGTRRATNYGREVTTRIASELAAAGVAIVSGLARGIDGIAHQAALEHGGRTYAVMASGVDIVYPAEHRHLAERIERSGALISDYPPGTKPDAPNFPARNRIISGLSRATIVTEAPTRSGALITVGFAADQGRDVYAVPGSILSSASEGTNRLIRQGAIPLTAASDLLDDLGLAASQGPEAEQVPFPMTDDERALYALVTSEPQHIDEIAYSADITISAASALLTMLELKGLVVNAGAQHYVATSMRPNARKRGST